MPHAATSRWPALVTMWPCAPLPLTLIVAGRRMAIEPSFVSPKVTGPCEAISVISKSTTRTPFSAWNRIDRSSLHSTLPS